MTALNAAQRAERKRDVFRLRVAGMSFRDIEARIAVPRSTAARYVAATCRELQEQTYASASALRAQTLAAIEQKMSRWWVRADDDPAALDRWLALARERSKLLGLYAPEQSRIDVGGGPSQVVVRFVGADDQSDQVASPPMSSSQP